MNSCENCKIIFLMLFPMHPSAGASASVDLSQYSVMLCGKVLNGVLSNTDIPEKIFSTSGMVGLILLINNEGLDAISYGRVISDRIIFFKEGGKV